MTNTHEHPTESHHHDPAEAARPSRRIQHAGHESHHAHMVADFHRRFWVCFVLSVPVVALAPMIQTWLGVRDSLRFAGDSY
ncbi:MAG: hypothetical protein IPM64_16830 [Phycisphaerales bacterium]|nr:hypothetical protein [Phycisphaerales bacterium]